MDDNDGDASMLDRCESPVTAAAVGRLLAVDDEAENFALADEAEFPAGETDNLNSDDDAGSAASSARPGVQPPLRACFWFWFESS